jgi:hypothetical protein
MPLTAASTDLLGDQNHDPRSEAADSEVTRPMDAGPRGGFIDEGERTPGETRPEQRGTEEQAVEDQRQLDQYLRTRTSALRARP